MNIPTSSQQNKEINTSSDWKQSKSWGRDWREGLSRALANHVGKDDEFLTSHRRSLLCVLHVRPRLLLYGAITIRYKKRCFPAHNLSYIALPGQACSNGWSAI